jgi:thiol-disulfide isomerase/thioredoxin
MTVARLGQRVSVVMLAAGLLLPGYACATELLLRVVNAETKTPVSPARVRASVDGRAMGATTDGVGECVIPLPDGGVKQTLSITVVAPGYVPTQARWDARAGRVEPLPETYTLPIEEGTVISGVVRDDAGHPVPGVSIQLYVESLSTTREQAVVTDHEVETDVFGTWQCDIVPAKIERIRLKIRGAGQTRYRSLTYKKSGERSIAALRTGTDVIVMETSHAVTGLVTGADGKPVAEARVVAWDTASSPQLGFVTATREDGSFTLPNCKGGDNVFVIRADGHAPKLEHVKVSAEAVSLQFQLDPGAVLRVQVTDPGGGPVAGAELIAREWQGFDVLDFSGTTDDGGHFTWAGAPPGEGVVFGVRKDGYKQVDRITLTAAEEERVVTMGVFLSVSGSVTDAKTGEVVPRFMVVRGMDYGGTGQVSWLEDEAMPCGEGTFTAAFDDAAPAYAVRIDAEGYMSEESRTYRNDEGSQTFNVTLAKGETLSGTVKTPGGEPAQGADVFLCTAGKGVAIRDGAVQNRGQALAVRTDDAGQFNFARQRDPHIIVILHDEGYAEATQEALKSEPTVTLAAWGVVEGSVVLGGKPAANESVVLSYERSMEAHQQGVSIDYRTVTDGDGVFYLDTLPPGDVRVARELLLRDGTVLTSHSVPATVRAGATTSVTVGGAGGAVAGRVALPDGEGPVPEGFNVRCTLSLNQAPVPYPDGLAGPERQEWLASWRGTDAGRSHRDARRVYACEAGAGDAFRIEDVPPGDYQLEVVVTDPAQGGKRVARARQELIVPEGDATPLDAGVVALERTGPPLVGGEAPDFETVTLDGTPLALADHRGKVVLLDFWATWCGPCRAELPNLRTVFAEFGGDDRFAMIGLNLDDDAAVVREYVQENGMGWIQGFLGDWSETAVPDTFGVTGIPAIMLIGPDGRLLAQGLRGPGIREAVRKALEQ